MINLLSAKECHIISSGSRTGTSWEILPLASGSRDQYDNLILLCNLHHKVIDDQPNTYHVQALKEMKASHEKWVRASLQDFDPARQHDDELYATLIEDWMRFANVRELESLDFLCSFGWSAPIIY